LLLVDDDPGVRALIRATFELLDLELLEADSVAAAAAAIDGERPDVIVLDVQMPGGDGAEYCARLKSDDTTASIPVILLTGSNDARLGASHADAVLRKPFSPLELLSLVERVAGTLNGRPRSVPQPDSGEQLLLYARDLRHLLEIERGQRTLLQNAYHETVIALTSALETKDTGTRAHSQRVQRYAEVLTRDYAPELLADPSAEYGFLLHDVGKIGIPDSVLLKPAALTPAERSLMQTHTVLGEQMLGGVAFLRGACMAVVRSHHERWDGGGYPDRLDAENIPVGARIFAVADALDAMTSDRPYRAAGSWSDAASEIVGLSGKQFDPGVVDAFRLREPELREVHRAFAA
jgi:ribonuclease P protein subunit RPR2